MTKFLLIIYNLFLLIFLVPILAAIALSGSRNRKDFFYRIKERLVMYDISAFDESKKTVWIHCASLGEARAVEPIIEKLKKYNIVVTTITKSAREYVSKLNGIACCMLAPVDIYPFVSKAVSKIKPDIILLIETEFWPSLIYCAKKNRIKIVTVNGRLSKTAFPYYRLTAFFWKEFLNLISFILVRNEQDYDRFLKITKNSEKILVTGNIKYDRDWTNEKTDRASLNLQDGDLILTAGSTRNGEEQILLNVFKKLKCKHGDLKLIIAPRHISRTKKIAAMLRRNKIEFCLFSQMNKKTQNDIVIVDVFGRLQMIYSVSDVVFVGGSIIKKGGQNPIEASAYAKPTIFGKHMYNFENEANFLTNAEASFEVFSENDLFEKIDLLLSDSQLRTEMGKKALQAVENQKGAVKRNIEIVEKCLNE